MPEKLIIQYNYLIKKYLKSLNKETTLYINYPFCASRCNYCIYHIDQFNLKKSNLFLECYKKEIELYVNKLNNFNFIDIHIGGGTPNLVSAEDLVSPLGKIVNFKKIKHTRNENNYG